MTQAATPSRLLSKRRRPGDAIFRTSTGAAATLTVLAMLGTAIFLVVEAFPAIQHYGFFSFLTSSRWAPSEATEHGTTPFPYGILQFIYGTILTSIIGMLIAVPTAIAVALYITNVAPTWLRRPLTYVVDLLAAIPSVVFGFWGIFALVPALKPIGTALTNSLGKIPGIGVVFAGPFFGVSYFTAGIILAIMVLPIVTAICREVFAVAPIEEKEAALALGATRWEMLRMAVLPRSRSGIIGAAILGFGRAVGETIAVTMVIGNNVLNITASIFGQGATMPSVIANEFTESTEPFHLDSLYVVGLWLLILALVFNIVGKAVVARTSEFIA